MEIKSLMSILEDEDKVVKNIHLANSLAERYEEELNHVYAYPIECNAKKEDIKRYMALVEKHRAEVAEYEEKLIAIRNEFKNYIMQLFP